MILICPSCLAKNRVPEEKLSIAPQCGQCHQPLIPLAPIELNEQNFATFIQNSDLPIFIDLWADWCGPCKMLSPILQEVKLNLKDAVKIIKVNVDQHQDLASHFMVRGVPTLMLFKTGKMLWRQSGVLSARDLSAIISNHLN